MTAEYVFTGETGIISVDSSDLLNDVKQEWIGALGTGLDTDASTPQGTLIQNETLARTSVMKNNAEVANTINPSYSYGSFLDALSSLTGTSRGKLNSTVVRQVAFEGNTGVTVDAGRRVRTLDGDVFIVSAPVALTTGVQVRGEIYSESDGNIPISTGELSIVDGKIGWGAVRLDTLSTVVPGSVQLNDSALKVARKRRLYQQGVAQLGSIYGRLLALPGVTSVRAIENDTGAAGTVRGITFSTINGVWICVAGTATDDEIAATLFKCKMGGQPWDYGAAAQGVKVQSPNGVMVTDPDSKLPYYVKFTRPVMLDLYVQITVGRGTSIANADDIKQAILNYAAGQINGEEGFVVGASASAFEIAGAVCTQYPGLYAKDAKVAAVPAGSAAPTTGFTTEVVASPWQQFQVNVGYILVTVVA